MPGMDVPPEDEGIIKRHYPKATEIEEFSKASLFDGKVREVWLNDGREYQVTFFYETGGHKDYFRNFTEFLDFVRTRLHRSKRPLSELISDRNFVGGLLALLGFAVVVYFMIGGNQKSAESLIGSFSTLIVGIVASFFGVKMANKD